ncbi:hypothetical protein A3K62_00530 [Candidatus Pacearchaeota archaeon RBG_16_35_8]|nr:MAG: hypothetical protein A3K62_00530 [Candidatus Pacearchaeota archaeon RBG_16_35_8]
MPKKRSVKKRASNPVRGNNVEKALIENFISTQRVLVNLSIKIDGLATQISKLLELFEISAKALAEKNFRMSGDMGNERIIQKIDTLLDQNKIIARGLTLMHELGAKPEQPAYPAHGKAPVEPPVRESDGEGYQRSIGSDEGVNFESPMQDKSRNFKRLPKGQ